MTRVQPFEATRPMVNAGVLAVNPWEEASGLDPEAVHCQPFDPWNHHAGPNIYRRHRIRLTSSLHDHSQIVTLTDDAPDYDSVPDTAPDTAPLAGVHDHLSETARLAVKSTDSYVAEAMPDHGKGSNVDTIDDAVTTIIAATRRVSITYQQQPALDDFSPA